MSKDEGGVRVYTEVLLCADCTRPHHRLTDYSHQPSNALLAIGHEIETTKIGIPLHEGHSTQTEDTEKKKTQQTKTDKAF